MRIAAATLAVLLVIGLPSEGAEYEGRNLDGETFSCTAFSYSTSKYYEGDCEFVAGTEVAFTFASNGKSITLEIDDEEIDDADSISAFDYKKSVYWDLDVDID